MTIEARIQQLEDIEAIRHLKYEHYCLAIDRRVCIGDATGMAGLKQRLAEDVDVAFSGIGSFPGREAAFGFFDQTVPALLSWCQHRVSNPIIDVNGDSATGHWYVFCPAVGTAASPAGAGPTVIAGRYVEHYARRDGQWIWTKLHAQLDVLEALPSGWQSAAWVTT